MCCKFEPAQDNLRCDIDEPKWRRTNGDFTGTLGAREFIGSRIVYTMYYRVLHCSIVLCICNLQRANFFVPEGCTSDVPTRVSIVQVAHIC